MTVLQVPEADDFRARFLRRVAHDIASPSGVALTVLDELAHAEKPRPELMAMARRSLRRLMRLSEHLALTAELEGHALEPERSPLDLRSLVKAALDDALAIDGRKEVSASCDVPSSAVRVEGDGRLLLVVLREIAGNAMRVAASRVQVSVSAERERATICVEDDGPGFADEAVRNLGRRFVTSSTRGLGLSLSIASEVLAAHGGRIAIAKSSLPPGRRGTQGAAVEITLPRAP